ncbi:MAG: hypothetical protein JW918_02085 [Anaerolineae bacterium]|nr:hypothetical protein [Anaerolineae bacterium]
MQRGEKPKLAWAMTAALPSAWMSERASWQKAVAACLSWMVPPSTRGMMGLALKPTIAAYPARRTAMGMAPPCVI